MTYDEASQSTSDPRELSARDVTRPVAMNASYGELLLAASLPAVALDGFDQIVQHYPDTTSTVVGTAHPQSARSLP